MKALRQYEGVLPLTVTILLFLYWAWTVYFHKFFVWDEIVSLTNFVLVPFEETVTKYPDVNNHVFFNLVNNFYCKLISITNLYDGMDKIPLIRLLPFILSLFTIVYTWLIGRRFFNLQVANMAIVVLISTIPFLNFTMQLRGYTLSTALFAASIYHLMTFAKEHRPVHAILSFFLVTFLLYTIPSNVFIALSLGLVAFLKWVYEGRSRAQQGPSNGFVSSWLKSPYTLILVVIGLAAAASYILYLPIVDDILNERHLKQMEGQYFYAYNLTDLFPKVNYFLGSYRFLIGIAFLFSLFFLIRNLRKYGLKRDIVQRSLFILLLYLTPFIISLVRGDKTPQRSFVPLSVPFALLSAISVYAILREVKLLKKMGLVTFFIMLVYCIFSYQWGMGNVHKRLHKAMLDGEKMNTMMYNFYQSDEYGMKYLDPLIEHVKKDGLPIVMAREIDRVSEGEYLQKNDLKYYSTVWSKQTPAENEAGYQYMVLFEISQGKGSRPGYDRIGFPPQIEKEAGKLIPMFSYLIQKNIIAKENPEFYVLTGAPRWFEGVMQKNLPNFRYDRLSPKLSYHNIYKVSVK